MVRETLRKIGLSDEEINIYLYLLKEGSSKATVISKKLGVARTTTYRFLSNLHDKGLVSETIQNNVTYYSPAPPERIPELLHEQIEEINNIIPDLQKLTKKKEEGARVELFKGKEGMKTVMRDIVRERKPYVLIGEAQKYFEELQVFSHQWIKHIEEREIHGRLLCSSKQKFKITKTEELRFIEESLLPRITTWTYGNKSAQFIWSNPFYAVLIESKSVADSNRKMFNYLWKQAHEPSKKT
jgi:sugar-specific transcriptional regulator TrmB